MIGTQILKGQGLGNRLFCYVTARAVAAERGAAFGVPGKEILLEGLTGSNEEPFLDLWMGQAASREDFARVYDEKEERIYTGACRHDLLHGCYVAGADRAVREVPDGTLLMGNLQDESYFAGYRDKLGEWLKVRPKYDSHRYTRDNLCVLNLRGGEYASEPALFLRKKYWTDAMAWMRRERSDMEFIIVTDDVEMARKLLPGIPAYHFPVHGDYVTVKNARYLIVSNSSFACFPAFTSETARKIIAPKYWARHNVSDGYWASEQNIYTGFEYLGRDGRLYSASDCREELAAYREKSERFRERHEKPQGARAGLMAAQAQLFYRAYYGQRALRSLKRRLTGG
ncbi:MAG: glycosyl transferase [Eubacteriales bacterium]|nr:glycosyl transferase [Eubacteriales bacterium]